ncbi:MULTISPECIES: hypothetical protein [Aquimarina]|uniref:hypothetical protein n=1 Tax=Aquimarina TaxID=290174 RepID=UPI000CDEED5F|nr:MULTISPECIES: hypothetical protein [Aquimarina]
MDELELLKKNWKKQEDVLPKLTYQQIYQMILKKSSSIVRWIFIISILEFLLWASLDVVFRLNGMHAKLQKGSIESFGTITTVVYYSILIYFIVRFYLNYKKIETTDSAKVLMNNILKTRKTVRHYIWVNIGFFAFIMMATVGYIIFFTDEFQSQALGNQPPVWLIVVSTLLITLVFVVLIALFYRVIYGIFTRRLQRNYKALEKIDL